MATQKISEMTEAIILQDEDYVPIVQSELNKKIKIEYLRDYNKLHNKPTLNGVTIENNKKLSDYNVVKANQGIKVNSSTKQTLELEVPTNQELEQRSDVNKAITIATADKMAKETAHQTMSKEYQPNSQDKLKEGEKQPVSYKAVKDYVDVLENKVDENERDIEAKVTALDQKTSQKDEELKELINTNEQDIEQKVDTIEANIDNLNNKDNEIINIINYGGKTSNGNEYHGESSDYGIEIGKVSGNFEQEGTPTPESPIEPKFFELKNVYSAGKNLFNPQEQRKSRTDTSAQIDGNDINVTGLWYMDWKVKVEPNTDYTISFDCNGNYRQLVIFDKTGNYNFTKNLILQDHQILQGHNSKTFNTKDNELIYVLLYSGNGSQGTSTYSNVMINKGTTEQPYAPFVGQSTTPLNITLRALPNGVCDTCEDRVITRRVGYIEFDGSEDEAWAVKETGVANFGEISLYRLLKPAGKLLSNKFVQVNISLGGSSNPIGVFSGNNGEFRIKYTNTVITLEELKTWLQSNPVKVWYELATPTTEQCNLSVIPSYFPYTNAWHDSEVEASELTWFINTYARNSEYTDEFLQKFFALQRTGKVYTVRFPLFSKSTSPTGEKMDHNEGLTCEPSTDTIIGQDDYQEISLFKTYDVNAYADDNGRIHVTAFKGDKYFKDMGKVDVFVLGMSYYEKYWEDDNYWYYSRTDMPRDGYTLCAECRNTDGSESSYALYSKYVSGEIDGKPYSSKGLIPKRSMSYNICESYYHSRGKNYGGSPMYLYKYLMTTFYLKYATLNTQSKIYGCFNYNYQYAASMAENNVKRIVLTTAQAANIVVGSYVSIGDKGSNSSVDRNNSYMHNKAEEVEVISKTTVDDSHVAINVDSPTSFNTTTTTYLSTMHWKSGFSDNVLGRDGSIEDLTSGKYPMVFQGIELAVGGYEVAGNAFMDIVNSTGKRDIYVTNDNSKIVTNVANAKSSYNKSKNSSQPTTLSAWNYITKMALDEENGMFNVIECGNSGSGSATGFCDGFYVDSAASGQREFLLLGFLWYGAIGGLSCVYANYSLSAAYWIFLARLSISGRKG